MCHSLAAPTQGYVEGNRCLGLKDSFMECHGVILDSVFGILIVWTSSCGPMIAVPFLRVGAPKKGLPWEKPPSMARAVLLGIRPPMCYQEAFSPRSRVVE